MSGSKIIQPGTAGEKPRVKKAFEINDLFKLAFLAGCTTGIDFFRNGVPLRTLAAMEEFGEVAFQTMFLDSIVDAGQSQKATVFFDQLWKQTFEGK